MHRFVGGSHLGKEIRKALLVAERCDLAVAFWGIGAISELGLSTRRPTRIIFDALTGASNPQELKSLLEMSRVSTFEVKHLSRLHSKVYLTPDVAFVGSANASRNGLAEGTIEAALRTEAREVVDQTLEWFDDRWKEAQTFDESLLQKAIDIWEPDPLPRGTFLETLLENPNWFRRRVRVVAVADKPSDDAINTFEELARNQFSEYELKEYDRRKFLPYYENGTSKSEIEKDEQPGDYIVDFSDGKKLYICRLKQNPHIAVGKTNSITLVEPRDDVRGCRFPRPERRILREAVEEYLSERPSSRAGLSFKLEDMPERLVELIRRRSQESSGPKVR